MRTHIVLIEDKHQSADIARVCESIRNYANASYKDEEDVYEQLRLEGVEDRDSIRILHIYNFISAVNKGYLVDLSKYKISYVSIENY